MLRAMIVLAALTATEKPLFDHKTKASQEIIDEIWISASEDGTMLVLSYHVDTKEGYGEYYFVVKGKKWGPYSYRPTALFYPQHKMWVVNGVISDSAQEYIVNGKKWGPFFSIECPFTFHDNTWGFAFEDKEGRHFVVIQGKKLGPFSSLELGPLTNSYRRTWQTFLAEDAKDKKTYVFVKGKKKGPFPEAERETFRFQGSSWGFLAEKEGRQVVLINGKEWGPYDKATAPALYEGPMPWAFVAKSGGEWFVMKGGEKVPVPFKPQELKKVGVPAMVSYGLSWGFMKVSNEGWHVVTENGTFGPFEKGLNEPSEFQVQPWGWSFISWLGSKQNMIVNGNKWTLKHGCTEIITSPDGKTGIFWCADQTSGSKDYSEDWYAVVNENKYGPYSYKGQVTYHAAGAHWAFPAEKKKLDGMKSYLVVDGKEFGPFASLQQLQFSGDGSSWAAVQEKPAKNCSALPVCEGEHHSPIHGSKVGCGDFSVIIDGKDKGSMGCYQWAFEFRYLPERGWWSLGLEREGKQYVAVNGIELGPYDGVTPVTVMGKKPPVLFAVKKDGKGTLQVVKVTLSSKD